MVTMLDVSRKAGVSTATVSRVINKPEVVDEKTRTAVQEAIAALHYRPNVVARGLASRSSRTIGVVINRFSSAYYGQMIDGAEHALSDLGYKTIAESSRETANGEKEAWQSLLDRQCEGIVVHSDNLDDEQLSELMTLNTSSVLMNRLLKGFEDRCVYLDNVRGGELVASHLLNMGHREFAVVTGPDSFYEAQDRLEGFESALGAAGIEVDPALIVEGGFTEAGGQVAMEQLLKSGKKFTAVFFHSDEMAAGGLEVCRRERISVPDDISMIGFDDVEVARLLTPKLTTVRQPLSEIGAAAGTLAHAIATKSSRADSIQKVFEAEVVERASVADISTD